MTSMTMKEATMEKLKVNMVIESDEELRQEMKKAYEACPAAIKYCNDLGIPSEKIDENIVKIFDFVCDINYCKKCPGVKKCGSKILYSAPRLFIATVKSIDS